MSITYTAPVQPLSLEEVLRQHQETQQRRPREQEASLRRIKAEHLKSRGDEAIKQGNFREAWERYGDALQLHPDKAALPALHSNRSLALFKAGRFGDALADADAAARLAPSWHKAHWRRATALLALKRAPEGVLAYREAWKLASRSSSSTMGTKSSSGNNSSTKGTAASEATECEARLWAAVQKLTREQLGRGMLAVLQEMVATGELEAPTEEEASEQEQSEAMFRLIQMAHKHRARPGPYYRRYLVWLQEGVQSWEAYTERAAVHCGAKCYLQARADAQAAIVGLQSALCEAQASAGAGASFSAGSEVGRREQEQGQQAQQTQRGGRHVSEAELRYHLALAFQKLGEGCLAFKDHVDRDCRGAAKAFLRAAEMDAGLEGVQEQLGEASGGLSLEEMSKVESEVYNEGPADGSGGTAGAASNGTAGGPALAPGQRMFRVVLRLAFPSAKASDCSSRARELLRGGVAEAAGVDPREVALERVAAPTAARPHLGVVLHVKVGTDLLKASQLAKAVGGGGGGSDLKPAEQQEGLPAPQQAQQGVGQPLDGQVGAQQAQQEEERQQQEARRHQQLAGLLGGEALTAFLGQPIAARCSAEIEDVTPSCAGASEAEQAEQDAVNRGEDGAAAQKERWLALPSRPKTELELPYRMYSLVRADGSLVERVDKHPFCMSRVYYDAIEKPEEVWAELADRSCRWRQTGGEVKVLALKVPADLPSKRLGVEIDPYHIKVWDRESGDVFMEGQLERGVVPEDCYWTHCGGEGEDGCALYLKKMNLELLQKHWMHSEMWWPRLFRAHANIAWDDYEKDYSDLPEEVLQRHRVTEAIKDEERQVENKERKHRDDLQEQDDRRKRTRQERLNELRTGTKQSWVVLNRGVAQK